MESAGAGFRGSVRKFSVKSDNFRELRRQITEQARLRMAWCTSARRSVRMLRRRKLSEPGEGAFHGLASAQAVAELLAARGDVAAVRYPGLSGDPAHEVAARQMRGFGPVLGFDLGDAERARRFLAACELVVEATSFGGVHSSAERRARWRADDVGEGFIRFSTGVEATEDLVADVERALDIAAKR